MVTCIHIILPGTLESMVMVVLMYAFGHVLSAWSSALWNLISRAVLRLRECCTLAVEWNWSEEGGVVVAPSRALRDAVMASLLRCTDLSAVPTSLEWELVIGLIESLLWASDLASEQYLVILVVAYFKIRRWHFPVWCRSFSCALIYFLPVQSILC